MRNDSIVAEVRAIRDKLAAQCGYDIKEIFQELRQFGKISSKMGDSQ